MPPFRVTFQESVPVDHCRAAGFRLNLWNDAASLQAASEQALRLGNLLNAVTAKQVEVCAASIRDIDNYRNATIVYMDPKATGTVDVDFPSTAIHCTLYGTVNQPVGVWLRGLDDNLVKAAKFVRDGIIGNVAWLAMIKEITNGNASNWSIRRVNGAIARIDIVAFNGLLTTTPTAVLAGPLSVVPGDKIRIQLVRGAPALKKVWRVLTISSDGLTVGFGPLAAPLFAAQPVITMLGKVRDVSDNVMFTEAITKFTADYATKKNVGRPPSELIGRRRTPR